MSIIVETIQTIATGATPLLATYIAFKGKFRFDAIEKKLSNLEATNKREHRDLNEKVEYVNARSTVTKALTKVCNSSISYTEGSHDINTFKTTFTSAVTGLSMATLTSGFKFLNKDIFHGYMTVAGNKIIDSYGDLPDEFVKQTKDHIYEASEVYYEGILELISDGVFNDKHDRFVDATISFLRTELMIITKHWWQFSDTKSTYKVVE